MGAAVAERSPIENAAESAHDPHCASTAPSPHTPAVPRADTATAPEPVSSAARQAHTTSAPEPNTFATHDAHNASKALQAQAAWAARPIHQRLAILRRARHLIANRAQTFADAISPDLPRTPADTLVAELLPLLDACRFLERNAARILRTRHLGRHDRPWWLSGIVSQVERVPFGQILIFGPANYPLFLPGVQTLQGLAAGNAIVWKPGRGGRPIAVLFAESLYEAGLPRDLLTIADESIASGQQALQGAINGVAPAKVIFTGSIETGRAILHTLADSLTPCVAELSGCDAVIALPSAPIPRLIEALCFGMRLNGSATCMAPRRLFLLGFTPEHRDRLLTQLKDAFALLPPITLDRPSADRLHELLNQAERHGATIHTITHPGATLNQTAPILITQATPAMAITCADIFAPVLSILEVPGTAALLAAEHHCPYALTVSLFGDEAQARTLARSLTAGTVLINDLIVPTADPRVPFGGRRSSGFGTTRGAEGLLEMTAPRTVIARTGTGTRHYEPTGPHHTAFFDGIIRISHAATWPQRSQALRHFLAAARNLK